MKNIFYTALMALLTFASCAQNEELPMTNEDNFPKEDIISIEPSIGELTRARTDINYFQMVIEHPLDNNYSYYFSANKKGNKWEYKKPIYLIPIQMLWKNKTDIVEIYAISHPGLNYSKEQLQTTRHEVGANQTGSDYWGTIDQSDILYIPSTRIDPSKDLTTDGKIKAEFRHAFAKLDMSVTFGSEFNQRPDGTTNNPAEKVEIGGTYRAVYFNIKDNTFGDLSMPEKIQPFHHTALYKSAIGNGQAKATYEAILIPQTIQANVFNVTFTIDGKQYVWISDKAITLLSGKQYTLRLKVGKDVIETGELTMNDWIDGTPIGDNDLETE